MSDKTESVLSHHAPTPATRDPLNISRYSIRSADWLPADCPSEGKKKKLCFLLR